MFADLRDNTTDKPRTTNAPAAAAALAQTEGSSYLQPMRAAKRTMPTTIGHTRRVLLLVCNEGDDVSIGSPLRYCRGRSLVSLWFVVGAGVCAPERPWLPVAAARQQRPLADDCETRWSMEKLELGGQVIPLSGKRSGDQCVTAIVRAMRLRRTEARRVLAGAWSAAAAWRTILPPKELRPSVSPFLLRFRIGECEDNTTNN